MINILNSNSLSQYLDETKQDQGEIIFQNISNKILTIINSVKMSHEKFNDVLNINNITNLCTNASTLNTTTSKQYNMFPVNENAYISTLNISKQCKNLDVTQLLKNVQELNNLTNKSIIQYFDISVNNTITYPYTSAPIPAININKLILNYYGNLVKFIYPCRSSNPFAQPIDLNYKHNNEQKIQYNSSQQFQESILTKFIQELSDYKQKEAACYGEEYITMGDKVWAIGIEDQVIDFVGRTYSNATKSNISQLFEALNKTIVSIHHNEQFRVYKQNRAYGSGQTLGSASMQIFIQDAEYMESKDEALQLLKLYSEINMNNQMLYNFEVLIFGQQVEKSVFDILSTVLQISRIDITIDKYIQYQMRTILSSDQYFLMPSEIDCFSQDSIKLCSLVYSNQINIGIICSSIPILQIQSSQGLQYIVDTQKEICLSKNSGIIFDYKYFLATCDSQHLIHFNQFKRTKISFNNIQHYFENINGYLRLILLMREIDISVYKLNSQIVKPTKPFSIDKCIKIQTSGYIFNTNNKYNIDCQQVDKTIEEQILKNDNVEATLLLSELTFDQLNNLKNYLGADVTVGRVARNNESVILQDRIYSEDCWQIILDIIYEYPNEPYFQKNQFHFDSIESQCTYYQGQQLISENITLLIYTHNNYLFTDVIILSQEKAVEILQLGSYNIITSEMYFVIPVTDNHLQLLFQEGALVCKLYDMPDHLHKEIMLGSISNIYSNQIKQLANIDAFVFNMVLVDKITFNCSDQVFSNEIMKNSQERADYFINTFVNDIIITRKSIQYDKIFIIIISNIGLGVSIIILLQNM
ncbi:Conserved_hypothetical protein [Hexamita inflata]|uniref:Transmembrane protein n=1 Tax=Hexamita inflata TaxID=28002 RepID=A0AA86UHX6_9EUKA|nr:Conserved hypothetical protein [Hexamita inflata]